MEMLFMGGVRQNSEGCPRGPLCHTRGLGVLCYQLPTPGPSIDTAQLCDMGLAYEQGRPQACVPASAQRSRQGLHNPCSGSPSSTKRSASTWS